MPAALLPERFGELEILDVPGRWKRIDTVGRGRIDTDRRTHVHANGHGGHTPASWPVVSKAR